MGRAGVSDDNIQNRQHGQDQLERSKPTQYAMYFHCQTNLVESFRAIFPSQFTYEGNRSIVFNKDAEIPANELKVCIAMALTYHRGKTPSRRRLIRQARRLCVEMIEVGLGVSSSFVVN